MPATFVAFRSQTEWTCVTFLFNGMARALPLISARMSKMLKSSGAMALATMASRVLGMVREMFYARFMGDGRVADAFVLAFMIPNLFRRLLGEGALTAAFIPIFKDKEKEPDTSAKWLLANSVISGLLMAAGALVVVVMLGLSLVIGWGDWDRDTLLMLELLRVMFPYMLLVCVAAVLIGMLNSLGFFFIPAMGATMLNVVLIFTVAVVAPVYGETLDEKVFALAFGVLVAGMAQIVFQIPLLKKQGYAYRWKNPFKSEEVKTVVRRMIPGTLGVAAFQINVLVSQSIAYASDGSIVASFNYAVRLMELPQGVFGISLATFLLPTLAGLASSKDDRGFRETLQSAVGYLFFINIIVAAVTIALAEPIVRLLFERGAFDAESTRRTSYALLALAPGLIAFSMVNIFSRAFFAKGDTKTPMKISVTCLAVNLILVILLVGDYKQAGLGIANSITAVLNAFLLYRGLKALDRSLELFPKGNRLWLAAPSALVGGWIAWKVWQWWAATYGSVETWQRIGEVFLPMAAACGFYMIVTAGAGVPAARDLLGLLRRRGAKSS